jgi:hypothetical protein
MPTQIQIQANRRNAQLSTGPRTGQGKAISRRNALKTGIDARNELASGEDPTALAAELVSDSSSLAFETKRGAFFNHLAELERRHALRRQHQADVDSAVTDFPQTENPEIGFVSQTTPNPAGPASPVSRHAARHDPATPPAVTRSLQTPSPGFGFVPHTTAALPPHTRPPVLPSAPALPVELCTKDRAAPLP